MLGKLLKHEFRAVNRLMIPLHLGLVVITIIGRFYVQFVMNREHVNYDNYTLRMWEGLMDVMLVSAYVIALIAIFVITWLYLDILRFRKNLFTDEGYLMHTLRPLRRSISLPSLPYLSYGRLQTGCSSAFPSLLCWQTKTSSGFSAIFGRICGVPSPRYSGCRQVSAFLCSF